MEALALHRLREAGAFLFVDLVGFHPDEFDPGIGDAEHVVGKRQIHAARHRLQQLLEPHLRGVQIRRREPEVEIRLLDLAKGHGPAADRIGEAAVRH